MEEGLFLPFSSLVASVLLYKKHVTSVEIINIISLLVKENIFIEDDIDDEIDDLMLCVDCPNLDYFKIKDMVSYDTCLTFGVTVRDFLFSKSNPIILDFFDKSEYFKKNSPNLVYKVKSMKDRYK